MKVKVLTRSPADHSRTTVSEIQKLPRNIDPSLHPFEKAREYKRALNATKMERMFAKPFLGALSGHSDGVFCMAKHPLRLSAIVSGACDGELRIWSMVGFNCVQSIAAHRGFVRGVGVSPLGDYIISVGDDKRIKQWNFDYDTLVSHAISKDGEDVNMKKLVLNEAIEPVSVIMGKHTFTSCDHHRKDTIFATSGNVVDIWDIHRTEPIHSYAWGADTINTVKFNPIETNIVASAASDRSVGLYDIRGDSPLRKLVLSMRTNAIAWNPMEAFNFTLANEDHNCYTFDMRRLDRALNVHSDHVSAVMDIDYSPTGREFATGGYDRSLRIFSFDAGRSRDIYHTKRMQRIFSVKWSSDAKYILCGSDETNIRLWKADAAEKLGTKLPRERAALDYADKLKETFQHHPEIKRIARHRHIPKAIYNAQKEKRVMIESRKTKIENKRKHSKPGAVPFKAERKKHIIAELK